jgi:hypothetical protein
VLVRHLLPISIKWGSVLRLGTDVADLFPCESATFSIGIQEECWAHSLPDTNSSTVEASEIKFNSALLSESVVTTQGSTDDLERREIECNLPATINNTNNPRHMAMLLFAIALILAECHLHANKALNVPKFMKMRTNSNSIQHTKLQFRLVIILLGTQIYNKIITYHTSKVVGFHPILSMFQSHHISTIL